MADRPQPKFSTNEYFGLDCASEIRHEYLDGGVFAMSGSTGLHAIPTAELARQIGNALEGRPCVVTTSDLKLEAVRGDAYFSPDVMVTCGSFQTMGPYPQIAKVSSDRHSA